MSGAARFVTMISASAANFSGVSFGERFSTLNVATASSMDSASLVTSRTMSPSATVGGVVTSSLKLLNE